MDFYLDPNTSARYYIGRPFTFGGMNYAAAGATDATFQDLGFQGVTAAPRPDDRFYVVNTYPEDDGTWVSTPRDLADLKAFFVNEVKHDQGSLLSSSDWYVTRKQETGKEIPADWATYRSDVRTVGEEREAQIGSKKSVKTLEALINAPEVIYSDPDDLDTASVNPAALKPWPVSPDDSDA